MSLLEASYPNGSQSPSSIWAEGLELFAWKGDLEYNVTWKPFLASSLAVKSPMSPDPMTAHLWISYSLTWTVRDLTLMNADPYAKDTPLFP